MKRTTIAPLAGAGSATFAALRHADFRALWAALGLSEVGGQMQFFALGWFAVELAARDGSPQLAPLYLGLLGLARAVPGLAFGVVGGVLADRLDRRRLLLRAQAASALGAGALSLVAAGGWGGIPLLMLLVLAASSAAAVQLPTEHAALPRLVPARDLMSAVGLMNASVNVAMFVGPLIAGALIGPLGVPGILALQAGLHLLAVVAVVRLPAIAPSELMTLNPVGAVAEGIAYVVRDRLLFPLMSLAILVALFGRAVAYVIPAVASDVLHVGPVELSWLLAARGLGTLAGSLAIASLGRVRRRANAAALSALLFGLAAALFSFQRDLARALLLAAAMGVTQFTFSGFTAVLAQTTAPDRLRGRVLSLYLTTVSGVTPLGVMILGSLGAAVGIDVAIAAGALLLVVGAAATLLAAGPVRDERALARETRAA